MAPQSPIGPKQAAQRREARIASVVIVVAMAGWMFLSFLGGRIGLPARFAFLIDLAALAAFAWAMIVCFKIWRARQMDKEG